MKITTIIPLIEDRIDEDHPPIVIEGHMSIEEATKYAQEYGNCYAHCECDHDDSGAAYRADFSDVSPLPEDPQERGDLSLLFYVGTTKTAN